MLVASAVTAVITTSSTGKTPTYEIRAIFDDAAFAVPGEDVRVAGAPVGSIQSLDVCTKAPCPQGTPLNKAAVTITDRQRPLRPVLRQRPLRDPPAVADRREVRRLSAGSSSSQPLQKITSGAGKGAYLLPVTNTTSPVDSDIVQDISQQPIRQRFSLILDELGTGLAARGSDLNAVIHRANPALGQTDKVLQILAHQNKVLARLATESDAVLAPLAQSQATARRLRRPGEHHVGGERRRAQPTSPARSSCSRRSCASCGRSSPTSANSPTRALR